MRLYTYVGMIHCILSGAESKGTEGKIKTDTQRNAHVNLSVKKKVTAHVFWKTISKKII